MLRRLPGLNLLGSSHSSSLSTRSASLSCTRSRARGLSYSTVIPGSTLPCEFAWDSLLSALDGEQSITCSFDAARLVSIREDACRVRGALFCVCCEVLGALSAIFPAGG